MSTTDFQLWLDQPVWVQDNLKLLRREYIPVFAEDITTYLRNLGFTMSGEWGKGHKVVARWMYIIMRDERANLIYDKQVIYPTPFHRDWPEDLDEFQHLFTHEDAVKIFDGWKMCEDFDQDTRVGQRYLHELQQLIYPYLDMDVSKAGMRVAIALEETESDSDSWRSGHRRERRDVYLEEAQEGYHGGKGFKV
jgi:hypothetical protein